MDVVDSVRAEVPVPPEDRVIVTGFNETEGPLGEIEDAKLTVPAKPRLARLIVDGADDPGVRASPLGFAER